MSEYNQQPKTSWLADMKRNTQKIQFVVSQSILEQCNIFHLYAKETITSQFQNDL